MRSAPVLYSLTFVDFDRRNPRNDFPLEAAGLRDCEKPEVVGGPFLAERTGDLPLDCQMTERSLSRVVVPWNNTVVVNKGKQRVLVPRRPLPISRRRVPRGNLTRDHVAIEVIDASAMFAEMTDLEAKPLNIFHERKHQVADSYKQTARTPRQTDSSRDRHSIQISDQMDEAFCCRLIPGRLLPAPKPRTGGRSKLNFGIQAKYNVGEEYAEIGTIWRGRSLPGWVGQV
jgi:hypothetical protein